MKELIGALTALMATLSAATDSPVNKTPSMTVDLTTQTAFIVMLVTLDSLSQSTLSSATLVMLDTRPSAPVPLAPTTLPLETSTRCVMPARAGRLSTTARCALPLEVRSPAARLTQLLPPSIKLFVALAILANIHLRVASLASTVPP